MNRPRLLIAVTQAEWGGVQGYVFRCAKEAQRRGFDVLMTAGGSGPLETRCLEANIPYRRLLKMQRNLSLTNDLAAKKELVRLMQEWKPDIAFLHSSKMGVLGSLAAHQAKVKRVVYRIGGWSFLDPVSPIQKLIRHWSEKLTAQFKHIIITLHPDDEAAARQHGIKPIEKCVVIPNGLDLATFDAALKQRDEARRELLNGRGDGPIVLTIANLYPAKDLPGYLDALVMVKKEVPNLRAVVIGEGEERKALEAKCHALGLDEEVSFPGAREDAATLLRGADIFVLPSAKEGMSWAILEAAAAQIPLVITDVGSNRWALGNTAVIIPPKNPEALAHAILDTLRNSGDAHIRGAAERRIVEERFTEAEMWEKTFAALASRE